MRRCIEALLSSLNDDPFDYLIVQSLDRLTRRPSDLARIVQQLTAAGTRLVTTANPTEAFLQDVSLFCFVAEANERRIA
jgi:DNA invertase Pin-like site-specific DNA recombinase